MKNVLSILGILLMIVGFGFTMVKITYWPDGSNSNDFYNFKTAVSAGLLGLSLIFAARRLSSKVES